jgi:hypothetical protein
MPHLFKQQTKVSVFLFIIKLAAICVFSFVTIKQVIILIKREKMTISSAIATKSVESQSLQTNVKSKGNGQTLPKTRQQVRQELEEIANKQREKYLQRSTKPPLHIALMDKEKYALIHNGLMRRLDDPYGKLYKQLNLNNSELKKLRELIAEKEIGMIEGSELAREAKMPFDASFLNTLRYEGDIPIRALLGDTVFARYKQYESTLASRNHVNALERRLSYKVESLTNDQYNALVTALSNLDDPKIVYGSGAWLGDYYPDITLKSLEIAKSILTPSQYAVYEDNYVQETLCSEQWQEYARKYATAEKEHRAKLKSKLKK